MSVLLVTMVTGVTSKLMPVLETHVTMVASVKFWSSVVSGERSHCLFWQLLMNVLYISMLKDLVDFQEIFKTI